MEEKVGNILKEVDKKLNKSLSKKDPVKRIAEKDREMEEHSPMDPPDVYDESMVVEVDYNEMHSLLQKFVDEHKVGIEKIKEFEKALVTFKEGDYQLIDEINKGFSDFFMFFDNNILDHNQREEKGLFPLLHERMIESGEKGEGESPITAVDMMEDDHVKFIQLATLAFNMLGLGSRLPDPGSRILVYDVAYENGRELVEMLRLHIYREDKILFPLAHKLISKEEFSLMKG